MANTLFLVLISTALINNVVLSLMLKRTRSVRKVSTQLS